MGQFGDKFRKAREAKKLSYDDVSRVTKIGARMLQAIEDEHFDQLPGGVFNKGFIRAYAKHLGLNDEEAVTDYLAALRQAQIEANEFRDPHIPAVRPPAVVEKRTQPMTTTSAPQPKPPAPKPPAPKPQPVKAPVQVADEELPELQLPRAEDVRPRRQFPAERESIVSERLIAVAAVVVILAVAFFWMRHTRLTRTEAASTATKPALAATSQQPAAIPASVAPTTAASTQPTPASASLANPPATKQPAAPVPSTDATNSTSPAGKTATENDVTVRVPAKPAPAAKPAPTMTLVIRATENSWISVVADGQLVSQETLIAPANTTVRATREITVKVGNAAAVSFVWNGKELPAQGAASEVKTLVFDATGMREATTQPAQ